MPDLLANCLLSDDALTSESPTASIVRLSAWICCLVYAFCAWLIFRALVTQRISVEVGCMLTHSLGWDRQPMDPRHGWTKAKETYSCPLG